MTARTTPQPVIDRLRQLIGQAWQDRLTDPERQILTEALMDAAGLSMAAMVGSPNQPLPPEILQEKRHINAQILSIACAAELRLCEQVWAAVREALGEGIKLALAAV